MKTGLDAAEVLGNLPGPLGIILLLVFGGGGYAGIAAIVKSVSDRRQGVAAHELAEDEAISQRWRAIIDAQVEALITPLREELAAVKEEQKVMKAELASTMTKYWRAISHIRALLLWITRYATETSVPLPPAPEEIMKDI